MTQSVSIDRTAVSHALAKAIAFKQAGKDADAALWARRLVELLECADILAPEVARVSYQPSSETVRIHREQVAAWRRACDRRLDRQLAARSDGLGELYRRGLDAVAGIAAEAKRHVVSVERTGDRPGRVQAACSCGWRGRALASRTAVSDDVADERDQLRRWGRHS